MVRLLFGGKTPETRLSIKEISDKLRYVVRDINVLAARHAAITDPLQRVEIEGQIVEKVSILDDFTAKFKKAFLSRLERNGRYIFKLLSNMNLKSLLARWPDPGEVLIRYREHISRILKIYRKEEFERIQILYGLRNLANNVNKKIQSNINSTIKAIQQKVVSEQKQQAEAQKIPTMDLRQQQIEHEKIGPLPADLRNRIELWNRSQQGKHDEKLGTLPADLRNRIKLWELQQRKKQLETAGKK